MQQFYDKILSKENKIHSKNILVLYRMLVYNKTINPVLQGDLYG